MSPIRSIVLDTVQEFSHYGLHTSGSAIGLSQAMQTRKDAVETRSFGQLQGIADELIDLFSYLAALEGAPRPAAMDLELENQVEVAQLKHPAATVGEKLHATKIVDDESANPCLGLRRDSCKGMLPARSTLLACDEQGVEEEGGFSGAWLECGQIQDPGFACELEPKTIGQEDQRAAGDLVGTRTVHKAMQCLAESITKGWQGHACPPLGQLTQGVSVQQGLAENRQGHSMPGTASPLGPNRPGSLAQSALSAPRSESSNPSSATGGFRMF